MPDREKVINALERCEPYGLCYDDSCPYYRDAACLEKLRQGALVLLKEQEAREPHYTTLKYLVDGTEVTVHHPECPRCIENGLTLWDAEIEKGQAFCKRCGQAVKWDER